MYRQKLTNACMDYDYENIADDFKKKTYMSQEKTKL